ncbi:MAG: hypothetical protein CM15mP113_1660 [Pseudomonadota bacterium]|nr:MAG: hypothetical protein CM15mP113_1660 [Pseudomonadota bacterium]
MKSKRIDRTGTWAPFGFMSDGMDDNSFVDKDGDVWHTDEYGDRSYMYLCNGL